MKFRIIFLGLTFFLGTGFVHAAEDAFSRDFSGFSSCVIEVNSRFPATARATCDSAPGFDLVTREDQVTSADASGSVKALFARWNFHVVSDQENSEGAVIRFERSG